MIAMALACNPKLLIADEPTTALDVTIQAQILDLMRDLKQRLGSAIMLITHDLGVVAEMCQRVVVMYAGRKVEEGAGRGDLRPSAASLYARTARFGAEARLVAGGRRPRQAGGDSRPGAESAAADRRLRVRRALPDGDRAVQRASRRRSRPRRADIWSPATTPRGGSRHDGRLRFANRTAPCHPRESGDPGTVRTSPRVPACAGMATGIVGGQFRRVRSADRLVQNSQ